MALTVLSNAVFNTRLPTVPSTNPSAHPSQVLAIADHDGFDIGRSIGPTREGIWIVAQLLIAAPVRTHRFPYSVKT
jgi:hypothetical protein